MLYGGDVVERGVHGEDVEYFECWGVSRPTTSGIHSKYRIDHNHQSHNMLQLPICQAL